MGWRNINMASTKTIQDKNLLNQYKKLRNDFMSYKFSTGSKNAKLLVSLERKLINKKILKISDTF